MFGGINMTDKKELKEEHDTTVIYDTVVIYDTSHRYRNILSSGF